jgi:hypothetical protein
MKVQFNTNILLWDENNNGSWLDELGFTSEDCGVYHPIEVDYIDYSSDTMSGNISICGIDYSFDIEGLFDDDHDFDSFPPFYLVD